MVSILTFLAWIVAPVSWTLPRQTTGAAHQKIVVEIPQDLPRAVRKHPFRQGFP
jgi:hypothetical protein